MQWQSSEKEIIDAGGLAGEAAKLRQDWVISTYAATFEKDGPFADLKDEALNELRNLLLTDAGSSEWSSKI
jgi:hypothetical protein